MNFKLPKGTNCMPIETQIDRNAAAYYKGEEAIIVVLREVYANRFWQGRCCSGNVRSAIATLRRYRNNLKGGI